MRQTIVRRLLKSNRADHVTAALVRRHLLEEARLSIKDTDARRAVGLVAGKDVKVAIQCLDVYLPVVNGLGPVDQNRHPPLMRLFDNPADRVNGAERVRHLNDRDELRSRIQELLVLIEQELPGI